MKLAYKVCSFGTEGRAATPQQEIPPQPNVFPLIVFKGSDVKDLKVEDSNPQPPPAQTQWGGYGYPQQQFGFPQYVTPPAPHFGGTPPQHSQHFGGPQYWQSPNQTQIPQMQNMNHGQMHQLPPNQSQMPPGMNNGNPGWGFPTRPSPSPAQAAAARLSPGTQTQKPQLKQSLQQQTPKPVAISKPSALLPNTSTPAVETITFGKVGVWDKPQKSQLALQVNKDIAADEFNDQKHVKSNSGGKKINLKQVRANSGRNGNQRDGEKSYQKDGGANGNGENAKRHDRERDTKTVEDGASGGESNTSPLIPGQERKPKPRKPKMVVPTEEFDFESSNAKFEKDEDDLHVEPVYTKSSFFDDISTDIKDRSMNETYSGS